MHHIQGFDLGSINTTYGSTKDTAADLAKLLRTFLHSVTHSIINKN